MIGQEVSVSNILLQTEDVKYDPAADEFPPGFLQYQIIQPSNVTTWNIVGETQQTLHIDLAPGQCVVAQRGAMQYMSEGIDTEVRFGGFRLAMGGDGLWKIVFWNNTGGPGYVGITNHLPGTLIPIDMSRYPSGFLCRRDSWVAHINDETRLTIGSVLSSNFSCAAKCCGGMPLIMQKVIGGAWVFLGAHGTIVQKELQPGEQIVCDGQSIVGMMETVGVEIRGAGTGMAMLCAGEGLFNTVLTGPGLVILESLPIGKLRKLFPRPPKRSKGGDSNDSD